MPKTGTGSRNVVKTRQGFVSVISLKRLPKLSAFTSFSFLKLKRETVI